MSNRILHEEHWADKQIAQDKQHFFVDRHYHQSHWH